MTDAWREAARTLRTDWRFTCLAVALLAVTLGAATAMFAAVQSVLLQLCQDMHGAMEYCHGIGVRLAPLVEREHGV